MDRLPAWAAGSPYPQQGEQWIELDWNQPVTTDGSSVYFLDDGGGVRLPGFVGVIQWVVPSVTAGGSAPSAVKRGSQ